MDTAIRRLRAQRDKLDMEEDELVARAQVIIDAYPQLLDTLSPQLRKKLKVRGTVDGLHRSAAYELKENE